MQKLFDIYITTFFFFSFRMQCVIIQFSLELEKIPAVPNNKKQNKKRCFRLFSGFRTCILFPFPKLDTNDNTWIDLVGDIHMTRMGPKKKKKKKKTGGGKGACSVSRYSSVSFYPSERPDHNFCFHCFSFFVFLCGGGGRDFGYC